jgi:hypothetical protein
MSDKSKSNRADGENERPRVYTKPQLKELGDVRELTLGGAGTQTDAHGHPHI